LIQAPIAGISGAFTIPTSVTTIGTHAFYNCDGLTGVTIHANVTSIRDSAFAFCDSLNSITIPASVTSIGMWAFHCCPGITSITFAAGSNISSANFGTLVFPEGSNGSGGDTLKTAYQTGGAGTYTRTSGGSTWAKQGGSVSNVLDGTWNAGSPTRSITLNGNTWTYAEEGSPYSRGTWTANFTVAYGSSGKLTLTINEFNSGGSWGALPSQYQSVKTNTVDVSINSGGTTMTLSNPVLTTAGVWGTTAGTYTRGGGSGGTLTITGVPQNLVSNVTSWGGSVGTFPTGTTLQQALANTNQNAGAPFEYAIVTPTAGSTYTVAVTLLTAPAMSIPWTASGSYRVFVVIGTSSTAGVAYAVNTSFSSGSATIAFTSFENLGTFTKGGSGNTGSWTAIPAGTGSGTTTFGTSDYIYSIAYGNGKWVAGGSNGKMAYSDNGTTWTAIPAGTGAGTSTFDTGRITSVAYGNNRFIAVGFSGKMAYSDNATAWTAVSTTAPGSYIYCIAYGNGRWIAGGSGNMAYSDNNGTTWTEIPSGTGAGTTTFSFIQNIRSIAYGNGRWVAVADGGRMAYSDNGTVWTAVTDSTFGTSNNAINSVAYGGGKFVAVGTSGKIASSDDGETWTAIPAGTGTGTTTFTSNIYCVAHGNGKFVAGSWSVMAYSANTTAWTAVPSTTFTSDINGIAYGGGKFVAVGDNGKMAYWADN